MGYICKYEGYFNPFNQLTHILILARKRPERCVVIKTVRFVFVRIARGLLEFPL